MIQDMPGNEFYVGAYKVLFLLCFNLDNLKVLFFFLSVVFLIYGIDLRISLPRVLGLIEGKCNISFCVDDY